MAFTPDKLIRASIRNLILARSTAPSYEEKLSLNTVESPFDTGLNRYPGAANELHHALSELNQVPIERILTGNGTQEMVRLLVDVFCEPGRDKVLILPPVSDLYEETAIRQGIAVKAVPLTENFQPDTEALFAETDTSTKLIFICSPNNPTANLIDAEKIREILEKFQGIVVIDEAFIDFSADKGWLPLLDKYPNLVVLQSFSTAWGLAGIRLAALYASEEITGWLCPLQQYMPVNIFTRRIAVEALRNQAQQQSWTAAVNAQREVVTEVLQTLSGVEKVHASDAGFLWVTFSDAGAVHDYLLARNIVVARFSAYPDCLRISIGTMEQNIQLLSVLKEMEI